MIRILPVFNADPNWHIGIPAPFNLEGAMWGGHLYTSILTRYQNFHNRTMRPLMLGTSDASHPAAHRYPGERNCVSFATTWSELAMFDLCVC